MNNWIMPMVFIVFGLVVAGFTFVSADLGDDGATVEEPAQGCAAGGCAFADKGGCTAGANCGASGCAAAQGAKRCGCGAGASCGGNCAEGGECGMKGCGAKKAGGCGCGAK